MKKSIRIYQMVMNREWLLFAHIDTSNFHVYPVPMGFSPSSLSSSSNNDDENIDVAVSAESHRKWIKSLFFFFFTSLRACKKVNGIKRQQTLKRKRVKEQDRLNTNKKKRYDFK